MAEANKKNRNPKTKLFDVILYMNNDTVKKEEVNTVTMHQYITNLHALKNVGAILLKPIK